MERTRTTWPVWVAAIVLMSAILLRLFVIQPYAIPSSSMEPVLKPGDRILVNRLTQQFWAPGRGDIVVFAYPKDPSRTFIKRVIAIEGEKVEIRDNQVFVNGTLLNEPYLKEGDYPPFGQEAIPKENVFVLGDNRRQSEDSREWGVLPRSYIQGKAWMIYYPLPRFKLLW